MKCKFEHEGVCCNIGAVQYNCECKQPCDTIFPMTNADCIRAMTDEELAHWICKRLPSCSVESCPGAELCNGTDGPSNGLVKWLQQPCGGADHA